MKRILFILLICVNSVSAQQKTTIKDSVLVSALNNFIDELKLPAKRYKFVIVRLLRSEQELVTKSVEKSKIGEVTGERVDSEYVTNYSVTLEYHVNSRVIDKDPATYYSIHREIPVLITTGVEDLLETGKQNNKEFLRELQKSSSRDFISEPIIWLVDVQNRKATVRKP